MGIIAWIILGLLAGAIAKILLPGRDLGGFVITILIGIAGALLGGWAAAELFDRPFEKDFFDLRTWGVSIAGSLVLLIAYRILFGHSRRARR
ncbi:GlsB/YeaQ/YmgE family stress response membrane protein [Streptomycetaceae bacterium NBC_01309]